MIEIDNILLNLSKSASVKKQKGEILRIGLRVPLVRKVVKADLNFLSDEKREVLLYWNTVWNESSYFESMSAALYFYQHKNLNRQETRMVLSWVNRCTCWEHSDDISKILAHMLEREPSWVLPTLKKWNKSKNHWKRRQSVVSLLEYSSKREVTLSFKELIPFVENLLADEEYYVQKGIGWTLREIYNLYPKRTTKFLETNLTELSSIAYSSATEKLDKQTKKSFNDKRKELRMKV